MSTKKMTPIKDLQRSNLLDAFRGFALIGFFLANMTFYSGYGYMSTAQKTALPFAEVDYVLRAIIFFVADLKFVAVFSIIFAVSYVAFRKRTHMYGAKSDIFFIRRIIFLLLISIIHILFFRYDDLLLWLGIYSFSIFLFRNKERASLAKWGIVIAGIIPAILMSGMLFMISQNEEMTPIIPFGEIFKAYSQGSFEEIIATNIQNFKTDSITNILFLSFLLIGLIMFGIWAGKKVIRVSEGGKTSLLIKENNSFVKRLQFYSGLIGITLNLYLAVIFYIRDVGIFNPGSHFTYNFILYFFSAVSLAIFYCVAFIRIFRQPQWQKRLFYLVPFGQMALTNYIFQSVLSAFLFFGIGLGLMGNMGPSLYIIWYLIIVTVQIIFSHWWLHRFEYGPLEWLWRCFTYGRWLPIKKRTRVAVT